MQERRATIRVPHTSRIRHCLLHTPEPRDGRIVDLSERGAGLLARESFRSGECISVGWGVSGARDAITATGLIAWSSDQPVDGHWHRFGITWFPLEETARDQLRSLLNTPVKAPHPRWNLVVSMGSGRWSKQRLRAIWILGGVGVVALLLWKYAQLETALQKRQVMIEQLQQREAQLQRERASAQTVLAETVRELVRLDQQTLGVGAAVEQLSADISTIQHSYGQLREEREQLIQRTRELEQERAMLAQQFSTTEALPTESPSPSGNRGYLIRVHEPHSALTQRAVAP